MDIRHREIEIRLILLNPHPDPFRLLHSQEGAARAAAWIEDKVSGEGAAFDEVGKEFDGLFSRM